MRARRGSSVAIVRLQWLWDSIWSFQRQPETLYLWNVYDWIPMNEATLPLAEEDEDFLAQLEAEDQENYNRDVDLDEGSLGSVNTDESTNLEDITELSAPRKRSSSQLDEEDLISDNSSSDTDLGALAAEI